MIKVHNTNVNYIQYGKGKDIILLHGWGQNIEMMKPLGDPLSTKYRITILDFPGFGASSEPTVAWTIQDYADMVHELVEKLQIKKPVIIGHSFGGRVAICYASCYEVEKVVLFGAPCVRTKTELSTKEKIELNKRQYRLMAQAQTPYERAVVRGLNLDGAKNIYSANNHGQFR